MRISDWSSDVCSADLHTMQQRSPTRQDDALVNDVSRKFGLRIFQRNPYRIDNSSDRLADSLGNFHLGNHYPFGNAIDERSEEHTSELQSLLSSSYAVFGLKKKKTKRHTHQHKSD